MSAMDARMAPPFSGCCDQCWHDAAKPCPDLVDCMARGPLCHDDGACGARLQRPPASSPDGTASSARWCSSVPEPAASARAPARRSPPSGVSSTRARTSTWTSSRSAASASASRSRSSTSRLPGRTRRQLPARHGGAGACPAGGGLRRPGPAGIAPAGAVPRRGARARGRACRFSTSTRSSRPRRAGCSPTAASSIRRASTSTSPAAATRASRGRCARMTPAEVCDARRAERPARPRRRRLPHRHEVEVRAARGGRPEVPDLQRRRGRPGRVHGPRGHRGRSAPPARGHGASRPTRSARPRRTSTSAPSTRWRSRGSSRPSRRPRRTACSGHNILDSGFNLEIVIKKGAGAFVCGEETALIHSIEGQARHAAPAAAVPGGPAACSASRRSSTTSRRWPTCPRIVQRGADWFARVGTRDEQGHEGVRALGQGRAHRAGRGGHGHHAPRRSSSTSAAASRTARRTRRCRSAGRPAAASPSSTSTSRSTTSRSRPSAR